MKTRKRRNPLFGGLFGGKKRKVMSKDSASITVDDGVIILSGKNITDIYKELTQLLENSQEDCKIEFASNSKPDKKYILNRPDVPTSAPYKWSSGTPTLEERARRRTK